MNQIHKASGSPCGLGLPGSLGVRTPDWVLLKTCRSLPSNCMLSGGTLAAARASCLHTLPGVDLPCVDAGHQVMGADCVSSIAGSGAGDETGGRSAWRVHQSVA